MKSIWFLPAIFLLAAPLIGAADSDQTQPAPAKKIVVPDELQNHDLLLPVKIPADSQQEYLEISAPDYPGLQFEVTSPLNQGVKSGYKNTYYPTYDPKYNSQGGMVLSYWGIRFPSGELVSLPVPVEKPPKKPESPDH